MPSSKNRKARDKKARAKSNLSNVRQIKPKRQHVPVKVENVDCYAIDINVPKDLVRQIKIADRTRNWGIGRSIGDTVVNLILTSEFDDLDKQTSEGDSENETADSNRETTPEEPQQPTNGGQQPQPTA